VKLRALLARAADPGQVESVLELRFLALCAAHGLPRPLTQVRVGRWRADFWFPAEHVVVETDGARFHATAAKRARDERKQGALEARGERVLRLTWAEVARRPAAVAERVREALATANVHAR
jgi:very-short-patch-repair endonuclease